MAKPKVGTAKTSAATGRHAALLRAINVGGNNLLPMVELAAMFADAGCSDVETYIASGNVVFAAGAALVKKLPALIEAAIFKKRGFRAPVVLRSAAELEEAVRGNPFLAAGGDPDSLYLGFLASAPSAAQIAQLDPERSPQDAYVVRGKELYLRYQHAAKTKLTNVYFDRVLGTTTTVRNWRTVLKLRELAAR